jgi:hypothetical protein
MHGRCGPRRCAPTAPSNAVRGQARLAGVGELHSEVSGASADCQERSRPCPRPVSRVAPHGRPMRRRAWPGSSAPGSARPTFRCLQMGDAPTARFPRFAVALRVGPSGTRLAPPHRITATDRSGVRRRTPSPGLSRRRTPQARMSRSGLFPCRSASAREAGRARPSSLPSLPGNAGGAVRIHELRPKLRREA